VGFLAGWVSIAVGFAAPVAANAVLLGGYLGEILGLTHVQAKALFSVPAILLVMAVHLGRLTFIGKFQIVFTYAKVLLILVLGALGFLLATAQPVSFLPQEGDGELILSGSFAISLVFVLYAYSGWNAATYMIDEVKNPRRTVPLAERLEKEDEVGGVETRHISGTLDVEALMRDLNSFVRRSGSAIGGATGQDVPEPLSGFAVFVALACDEIIMHPDAELGDIGLGKALDPDDQQQIVRIIEHAKQIEVERGEIHGVDSP
jgi:hypothetical protein